MKRKPYVVEPRGLVWCVRSESANPKSFQTLGEAVEYAVASASGADGSEVLLRNAQGELHRVWPEPHPR